MKYLFYYMDKKEGWEGDSDTDRTQNPKELEDTYLGPYLLEEFVLKTNKKWIFKGIHPSLDLPICIKVLRPDVKGLKVFSDEIENLKALSHSNLEQIFDRGEYEGYHYLISRFVKGRNLREEIESGRRFSLEDVLEIANSVLGALDYANRAEHPHTDVKLKNIILENGECNDKPLSERVNVVDFGPWDPDDVTRNHVSGTAGDLRLLLYNLENLKQNLITWLKNLIVT